MTGMTFSIGMRPPGARSLGGVPVLAVAVAVAFVAVAASAEAAVAVRGVRVAGAAAFERAGRAAGDFAGVARLLFVLITPNVSGGGARRESPGDLPGNLPMELRAFPLSRRGRGPMDLGAAISRFGMVMPVRAIRRFTVRTVLPSRLAALGDLVMNLRWSWHAETLDLLESIDPQTWRAVDGDPGRLLGLVPHSRFAELSTDEQFLSRLDEAAENLRQYLTQDRWFQSLGRDGWQQERYPPVDPHGLPLTLLTEADGSPVTIPVRLPGRDLQAQVWLCQVGRIPLLLLDSDVEGNAQAERDVTDRLYGGGTDHRFRQELLLGVGGVRAVPFVHVVDLGLR